MDSLHFCKYFPFVCSSAVFFCRKLHIGLDGDLGIHLHGVTLGCPVCRCTRVWRCTGLGIEWIGDGIVKTPTVVMILRVGCKVYYSL